MSSSKDLFSQLLSVTEMSVFGPSRRLWRQRFSPRDIVLTCKPRHRRTATCPAARATGRTSSQLVVSSSTFFYRSLVQNALKKSGDLNSFRSLSPFSLNFHVRETIGEIAAVHRAEREKALLWIYKCKSAWNCPGFSVAAAVLDRLATRCGYPSRRQLFTAFVQPVLRSFCCNGMHISAFPVETAGYDSTKRHEFLNAFSREVLSLTLVLDCEEEQRDLENLTDLAGKGKGH